MSGLSQAEVETLRDKYGFNEVKTNQTPEWKKIAKRYLDWVSIVIFAAAIISVAVEVEGGRGWTSFVLLLLELNLIVWVGYYSERNAGDAVKELEALTVPMAQAKRDGKWQQVPARELLPGDVIALKGGDVIPADSKLVGEGEPLLVDESSLTGESLPATRKIGDQILAGATVTQGELEAEVTATGKDSFFGKTIALLGAPEERGHLQTVLNQVSIAFAVIAFFAVIAIMIVLIVAQDASPGYAVVTAFVIFVAVVPIGMPVVTTTVLAVGAREMAAEKAIVTRLSALEELSGMEVLASDKTGTLTLNQLTLDKEDILAWGDSTKDDVLLTASLSAKWDHNDAIDKAVTAAMGGDIEVISGYKITKFLPFNPVDKKTVAHVTMPDGSQVVSAKGAPQIIRDLLSDPAAQNACDEYIAERGHRGLRSMGVAKSSDGGEGWTLTGLISLLDPPRLDSAETIRAAQGMGVAVKMVTGDQLAIAIETSRRLGLGTNIMEGKELMGEGDVGLGLADHVDHVDGFAGVYPEHKHRIVEALQRKGRLVGMTGDGVNDAPALKKANVGIAVAGATAAAKGAADIVLTQEGISTIITAIRRSRMIFRRLETYIIYRMASSILILGFFFFAIIIMTFEMPTWVLVLISLFNDLSVMATSFDKVHSSDHPELWNMTKDLLIAAGIASVGILGSVLLLYFASLDYANWWPAGNGLERTGKLGITPGQVVAVMFLALVALIQLQILLTRNPTFWWKFGHSAPRPSVVLLIPMILFLLAATFIAVYWPNNISPDGGLGNMEGAGWVPILITWAYVIAWWLLADLVKVAIQRVFARYDVIVAACKETGEPHPGWVRALDAPANWVNKVGEALPSPSLNFARTLDARVPGSKALHKSRAFQKLIRRKRAPAGAPDAAASSVPNPSKPPPPQSLAHSHSRSLVEVVSEASEAQPRRNVLARKGSHASVLPTTVSGERGQGFGRKASAPNVLMGAGGRHVPAESGGALEIVVEKRQ